MYIKIGDLKLEKIKVFKDDTLLYEGLVEDAPHDLKETNYKTASFESDHIVINI